MFLTWSWICCCISCCFLRSRCDSLGVLAILGAGVITTGSAAAALCASRPAESADVLVIKGGDVDVSVIMLRKSRREVEFGVDAEAPQGSVLGVEDGSGVVLSRPNFTNPRELAVVPGRRRGVEGAAGEFDIDIVASRKDDGPPSSTAVPSCALSRLFGRSTKTMGDSSSSMLNMRSAVEFLGRNRGDCSTLLIRDFLLDRVLAEGDAAPD